MVNIMFQKTTSTNCEHTFVFQLQMCGKIHQNCLWFFKAFFGISWNIRGGKRFVKYNSNQNLVHKRVTLFNDWIRLHSPDYYRWAFSVAQIFHFLNDFRNDFSASLWEAQIIEVWADRYKVEHLNHRNDTEAHEKPEQTTHISCQGSKHQINQMRSNRNIDESKSYIRSQQIQPIPQFFDFESSIWHSICARTQHSSVWVFASAKYRPPRISSPLKMNFRRLRQNIHCSNDCICK